MHRTGDRSKDIAYINQQCHNTPAYSILHKHNALSVRLFTVTGGFWACIFLKIWYNRCIG